MATWLFVLIIILSYFIIGIIIAIVWEKVDRKFIDKPDIPTLFLMYDYINSSVHTNYYMVVTCTFIWPLFLLFLILGVIYELVRKIVIH